MHTRMHVQPSHLLLRIFVICSCSWTVSTNANDTTLVCDVLTGTDDGLLLLPLDKTSIPPTFGSPKKLIAGNGIIIAIAVDNDNGRIYWCDKAKDTIYRANFNGSDQISIVNVVTSFGIVVISEEAKVFFTRHYIGRVHVVHTDGGAETIIYTSGQVLLGLAIDLKQSLMFFASPEALHKSNIDGSEHVVIAREGMLSVHGVALDHSNKQVCWTNKGAVIMECSDYDGQKRRVLRRPSSKPVGIYIEDDLLLWSENSPPRLYSAHFNDNVPRMIELETKAYVVLERCQCPLIGRYVLDPPMKTDMSIRLNDADNETCLALSDMGFYKFDARKERWFPPPQNKCVMSGLVIKRCVPAKMKTSFTVTITGHHLECSTAHFKVAVRQTKWSSCHLAGLYRICKWSGAFDTGGLTTCVAACRCDGDDCKHLTIHIPKLYEDWRICEINVN